MIDNALLVTDWEIRRFLAFILFVQLVVVEFVLLGIVGFDFPVLRQIAGFLYLTFIPGVVILRVLRLHRLGTAPALLYSAGLSLSFCMFIGLLLNFLGPLIGFSEPLTPAALLLALTVSVLILCALAYWRDGSDWSAPRSGIKIDTRGSALPSLLFLFLIVLVSVSGALLVQFHNNNVLLLIMIVMICIVVALVGLRKFIPPRLYPVGIVAVSVALLYHYTLVSPYLTGWDVHHEYYVSQLTQIDSYWDPTLANSYHSMLSITLLPTIYSQFLNVDVSWIYKAAYPLIFSLVPLALYEAYRRQTNRHIAFLAVFFFVSLQLFFTGMPSLARQQIAELFLALLILLMVSKGMPGFTKATLAVVFSASLVVSHYSISYILIVFLLLAWPLLPLLRRVTERPRTSTMLTGTFAWLFFVMALGWYIFTAGSASFASVVLVGESIYANISDFVMAGAREASTLKVLGLGQPVSALHDVGVNFYRVTQFFIVLGILRLAANRRAMRFDLQFVAMTLLSTLLLFVCVVVPYFAEFLHVDRLYHVTLFFLSPFCILGGQLFFQWLFGLPRALWIRMRPKTGQVRQPIRGGRFDVRAACTGPVVLFILIPYFLFTSGFIFEVTGDEFPTSIALSQSRFQSSNIEEVVVDFHAEYTFASDVASAEWLSAFSAEEGNIYSDELSKWYILPSYGLIWPSRIIYPDTALWSGSYTYLSHLNVTRSLMHVPSEDNRSSTRENYNYATTELSNHLESRIYSNGESAVHLAR